MPVPLLFGFSNPVDRSQPLKQVVLIPVPSGPFGHQLGYLADVGRPFELAELRITTPDAVRAGAFHPTGPALIIARAIGAVCTLAHPQEVLLGFESILGYDDETGLVDLGGFRFPRGAATNHQRSSLKPSKMPVPFRYS